MIVNNGGDGVRKPMSGVTNRKTMASSGLTAATTRVLGLINRQLNGGRNMAAVWRRRGLNGVHVAFQRRASVGDARSNGRRAATIIA